MHNRRRGTFIQGFRYAFVGLGLVLRTRNLRAYLLVGVVAIALGLWLHLEALGWTVLVLSLALSLFATIVNVVVTETIMDLASIDQDRPMANVVKDMSAGAVLVAAIAAVAVGLLTLGPPLLDRLGLLK